MRNWFPLTASRMESVACQKLTAAERLYLEYIVSEFSRRGPFYQSDLEIAVTLGMSEIKVRQARRKVGIEPDSVRLLTAQRRGVEVSGGYGWIVYEHGWKRGAQSQATKYLDAPMAERKKGDWFASVPRYTFEVLLSAVRAKKLSHADVVVWLVLSYKYWRCRGNEADHPFFVTKKELGRLSGVVSAADSVRHLHQVYDYEDEQGKHHHLFEFSDQYQRLTFENWGWFLDPSESETCARLESEARQSVATKVSQMKAAAERRTAVKKRKRLQCKSPTT